jgi:hypothetical protein
MRWFHTIVLPLATMFAVYMGVKKKSPSWKHGALVLGCGLMLSSLWLTEEWSTLLLIGGGVLFFLGVPRSPAIGQIAPSIGLAPSRVAGEPGSSAIHISFSSPRFLMGGAQLVLLLDGMTIHAGGFKAGIDVTIPVAPGQHRLEAVIDLGIAKRRRAWDVAVPPSGCGVMIEYSRFWGNFAKGVRISSLTASA